MSRTRYLPARSLHRLNHGTVEVQSTFPVGIYLVVPRFFRRVGHILLGRDETRDAHFPQEYKALKGRKSFNTAKILLTKG